MNKALALALLLSCHAAEPPAAPPPAPPVQPTVTPATTPPPVPPPMAAAPPADAPPTSAEIAAAKKALVDKHPDRKADIERGVDQVAKLWRTSDGDLAAF